MHIDHDFTIEDLELIHSLIEDQVAASEHQLPVYEKAGQQDDANIEFFVLERCKRLAAVFERACNDCPPPKAT